MKSYTEHIRENLLTEMPVAVVGDWFYESVNYLGTKSLDAFDKNWVFVDDFEFSREMKLYRLSPDRLEFILGYEDLDYEYSSSGAMLRFRVVMRISLRKLPKFASLEKKLTIGNLVEVNSVAVLDEFRYDGIAKTIYKFLVDFGFTIMSDGEQYIGARKLYQRLSLETKEIAVDVIDLNSETLIDRNVTLHHGKLDSEFDQRFWSSDESKYQIRFLLRKIS